MDDQTAAKTIALTKTYTWHSIKVPALRGIDLTIRKGEFVSIVGPSGSGKSTLLQLLGILDTQTSGKILIDGVDTSTLSSDQLAELRNRKIGFIFQSYNLINRSTILKNVELPAIVMGLPTEKRKKRASELLESVGLGDTVNRKPTTLSGGQQQRVAVARALMNEPAIVLADEPTGNLDSKTGGEIFNLMKSLSREKGATIVVVTHNLELAEVTNRIIKLRDGLIEGEIISQRSALLG